MTEPCDQGSARAPGAPGQQQVTVREADERFEQADDVGRAGGQR